MKIRVGQVWRWGGSRGLLELAEVSETHVRTPYDVLVGSQRRGMSHAHLMGNYSLVCGPEDEHEKAWLRHYGFLPALPPDAANRGVCIVTPTQALSDLLHALEASGAEGCVQSVWEELWPDEYPDVGRELGGAVVAAREMVAE